MEFECKTDSIAESEAERRMMEVIKFFDEHWNEVIRWSRERSRQLGLLKERLKKEETR